MKEREDRLIKAIEESEASEDIDEEQKKLPPMREIFEEVKEKPSQRQISKED